MFPQNNREMDGSLHAPRCLPSSICSAHFASLILPNITKFVAWSLSRFPYICLVLRRALATFFFHSCTCNQSGQLAICPSSIVFRVLCAIVMMLPQCHKKTTSGSTVGQKMNLTRICTFEDSDAKLVVCATECASTTSAAWTMSVTSASCVRSDRTREQNRYSPLFASVETVDTHARCR